MRRAARPLIPAILAVVAALALSSCDSVGPASSTLRSQVPQSSAASVRPSGSAPTTTITCVPTGSGTPTRSALHSTLGQLRNRARTAGLDAQITLRADGTFVVVLPRSEKVPPKQLCASASITFRPVIVGVQQPRGRATDPTAGLGFALPRDERGYLTLPAAQRKAVDSAVRSLDCASTRATATPKPVFACDADGHAYLLAAPIVDGSQVTRARATEPNPGVGPSQWSVQVDLTARARAAIATYTTAHNFRDEGRSPGQPAAACDHASTPCADFFAVVIDGRVHSAPAIADPIPGGSTQITGHFDAAQAQALAAQLQTPLAVPLRVNGPASPQPTRS